MQVIIDIDDEEYNRFKKAEIKGYVSTQIPISTIMNGVPLDNLRAKIKGKIIKRPWLDFEDRERDRNDAFLEVLDIIDKYKEENKDADSN